MSAFCGYVLVVSFRAPVPGNAPAGGFAFLAIYSDKCKLAKPRFIGWLRSFFSRKQRNGIFHIYLA